MGVRIKLGDRGRPLVADYDFPRGSLPMSTTCMQGLSTVSESESSNSLVEVEVEPFSTMALINHPLKFPAARRSCRASAGGSSINHCQDPMQGVKAYGNAES